MNNFNVSGERAKVYKFRQNDLEHHFGKIEYNVYFRSSTTAKNSNSTLILQVFLFKTNNSAMTYILSPVHQNIIL